MLLFQLSHILTASIHPLFIFYSHMRSLTQSSAGVLVSPSNILPVTLPPCHHLNSMTVTQLREGPMPPNIYHPPFVITTPNQHSFFCVGDSDDTSFLSPQSRSHVSRAIQNGWADSTIRRYSGAIRQYIRFCEVEGVPAHLRFPADEFVLCAFAASSAGRHARSTPRNRLSALKAWHIAHNMQWKGSSRLRYVLNGVHNLAPGSSRRPPRPPVNAKMISQLIQHLNLDSPLDVAVAACAATAFWGQCRLGELLPISAAAMSPSLLPIRSGFKRSIRNPESCILHLPRTKTHCHGQNIVLVDQCASVDPISLLKRHLRVNNVPNAAHIFSYSTGAGHTSLTKSTFLQRCNDIWQLLGYPHTTGHCFRIGGTTELLLAGTPPDVVKAMGRWSSDSFLRYWRSLEDLAPQYIRHLHSAKTRRRR